jgi:hypothetical protein
VLWFAGEEIADCRGVFYNALQFTPVLVGTTSNIFARSALHDESSRDDCEQSRRVRTQTNASLLTAANAPLIEIA